MRNLFPKILAIILAVQSVYAASFGSGLIISDSGHIVTCAHCIPDNSKIAVLTSDGLSHEATVLFRNKELDLACLKIESKTKSYLRISDSTKVKLLDQIYVFGFPLPSAIGNELSASKGTLNAVRNRGGIHLLQIDAPVNPGNSGGPVLNNRGSVIGIAVSKLDPIKAIKNLGTIPERINFAVPSSILRKELTKNKIAFSETIESRDLNAMRTLASAATVQIIATQSIKRKDSPKITIDKIDQGLINLTKQAALNYVLLGNSKSLKAELSIYADKVDYYDQGIKSLAYIKKDLTSLRKRWNERYYVITSVDQVDVKRSKSLGAATISFRFALFNGDKFYRGDASTFVVFDLSSGEAKVILVREHKTNKKRDNKSQ